METPPLLGIPQPPHTPKKTHLMDWQAYCCCLLPQQLTADSMHGNSLKPFVDRCEQPNDLYILPLTQCVQSECTVLAAAPGQPNPLWGLLITHAVD